MARLPSTFGEFVGQKRVTAHLRRLIQGARSIAGVLCSLIIIGPTGTGKTKLARSVAQECGTEFASVFASGSTRPEDLATVLKAMRRGDVLHIDEAHALTEDCQQLLHSVLDDWRLPAGGDGESGASVGASVAESCVILTTDQPGRVRRALRNRLQRVELDVYTFAELREIASRTARAAGFEPSGQAASALARASQGSPRNIALRLEGLVRFVDGPSQEDGALRTLGQTDVVEYLESEGIDESGLTPLQRRCLITLAGAPGGSASAEHLSLGVGCDLLYLRQEIERYLIKEGLIEITPSHRRYITAAGRAQVSVSEQPRDGEVVDAPDPGNKQNTGA